MTILEALRQVTTSIKSWAESKFLTENDIDYPVESVNGKTGEVQLTAFDVGALPLDTDIPSVVGLATEEYVNNAVAQKSQVQIITDEASEVLQTLKIHRLTQEEYNQKLSDGTINENALYLTPDEEIDLSGYVTVEQLSEKADLDHSHDNIYYTEMEVNSLLENKASTSHNHDGLYDAKGSADEAERKAKSYVDELIGNSTLEEHDHVVNDITDFVDSVNALIEDKNYTIAIETAKSEAVSTAQSYADSVSNAVKNELLNGAGEAYDTLKELGDLINENVDAIEALEIVASSKADANHTHNDIYYTETEMDNKISTINTSIINSLSEAKTYTDNAVTQMSSVQIITWEADD